MKKLIPAIVMLLVSAVVLSTASYAWFSSSNIVTASGMSVTAQAPTSILIKDASSNSEFASSVDFNATKSLTACSSIDGVNFFAPELCEDMNGAMKYNTTIKSVSNPSDAAATTGWYYFEKTVTLKNAGSDAVNIYLDALTITNIGTAIGEAVRVAILDDQGNVIADVTPYVGDGTAPAYVKVPTGTNTYSNDSVAVGPLFAASGAEKTPAQGETPAEIYTWAELAKGQQVVNSKTMTSSGEAKNPTIVVTNLGALAEKTLTIRIWIEGQDTACFSTNANQSASITMKFGAATYVAPQG